MLQRRIRHTASALLTTALLTITAPGQSRTPSTGRVFDKEHKPIANAKVSCVSGGTPGTADAGDLVQVETDATGRFRAQLLPLRPYVAWAAVERGAETAVSDTVDLGDVPVDLVVGDSRAPRTLTVTGVGAWSEHAPLRIEIEMLGCAALTVRDELRADGIVPLPPLPVAARWVRITAKERLVFSEAIGWPNLALPAPRKLRMRVADERDQPLPKATIQRLYQTWSRPDGPFGEPPIVRRETVGTTDDAGNAEILFASATEPLEQHPDPLVFVASCDGHDEGLAGVSNAPFCNAEDIARLPDGVLPFRLQTRAPTLVKLAMPAGSAPAAVQAVGYHAIPLGKGSLTSTGWLAQMPVVDGAFALSRTHDPSNVMALTIPDVLAPVPAGDPWARCVRPRTLVLPPLRDDAREIDLRNVRALRLRVLDASAGPAIGAYVVCSPYRGPNYVDTNFAMHARTDRAGRVVLPVTDGKWFVMAVQETGFAHEVVDASANLAPTAITLRGFDTMRARVVDAMGKPVAGASFHSNSSSWIGGGSAEQELLRGMGWSVSNWVMQRCTTDADGMADVRFLAASGLRMQVGASVDNRQSGAVTLQASTDVIEFSLR